MQLLSKKAAMIFILPGLILIFIFLIFPALWTFFLSLTNYSLLDNSLEFVGLKNFFKLFRDQRFWHSTIVTFQFVIGSALFGQTALGLLLAVMLHKKRGIMKELLTNFAVASWIIPSVVVVYLWAAFLDKEYGLLNQLLGFIGVTPRDWLNKFPMWVIIIWNIWRGSAFSMMLFTSALQTIPPSYLETADVIGASRWNKFRDILLPSLKNYIGTDLILITLWTFNLFTPYLLTKGGPGNATEIFPIYTYHEAFKYMQFGYGSAISVVILLINLGFALFYLRSMKGGKQ
ncbi:MAG: multiple sugar transport system permease protein [Halanaerobiales bacterium]|nr:multiple sugar transport system permease protein [Halanaerobiales bacterium]